MWTSLVLVRGAESELGQIRGVVKSGWDATPVSGVTVILRGSTLAVRSEPDGRFLLSGVPPGMHSVGFSKGGFVRVTVNEVYVGPGQVSAVDVVLRPEFYDMEEYEVRAEELEEQNEAILLERQDALSLIDAIGLEQLGRYAATDVADAVSRVPGTTIVDGKYAVIRGLNDRYTVTLLNGGQIPTADPYRKAVQLDLFPASMVEQIRVSKTFTPDLPGETTGGAIDVVTKSFPEKFHAVVAGGVAYNTQASLRDDFPGYPGGSLDWLGMDDGTRALPPELSGPDVDLPDLAEVNDPRLPLPERRSLANQLDSMTRAMGYDDFAPSPTESGLDKGLRLEIGDTVRVGDRRLGYFAGLSYDQKWRGYDDGLQARYYRTAPIARYQDTRGIETVNWAAIANLAYEFSEGQEISFLFLFNQNSEDTARRLQGTSVGAPDPNSILDRSELRWTQRNLTSFQLGGDHEFPEAMDWKVDWLATLSGTSQEEPDLRYFNFFATPTGNGDYVNELFSAALPTPSRPARFWRELSEDALDLRLNNSVPYTVWDELEARLKFGAAYTTSDRSMIDQAYYYNSATAYTLGDYAAFPNSYLNPGNFGYRYVGNTFIFQRYLQRDFGSATTEGGQDVAAGYIMTELPLREKLRFVGGVRYEGTSILIEYGSGGFTDSSTTEQGDWLPSAGFIWDFAPAMDLRLSYGGTLARPRFLELSPVPYYDANVLVEVRGNPDLQISSIENYDLRWEWFPRPGEVVAASAFYKRIHDPIEMTLESATGDIVTFENREQADLYGLEFEGRRTLAFIDPLLQPFSLGGNFAYIVSSVPLKDFEISNRGTGDTTRPLYDQSPYILNVDLTYAPPDWGTTATVSFQYAGPRIFLTSDTGEDVYEHPPPILNVVISQRLAQHWVLKFSAKNLLDPEFLRTYGNSADTPYIFSRYTIGRTFGLSLSLEF